MDKVPPHDEIESQIYICPYCSARIPLSINPLYCHRCARRLPRDENNRLIIKPTDGSSKEPKGKSEKSEKETNISGIQPNHPSTLTEMTPSSVNNVAAPQISRIPHTNMPNYGMNTPPITPYIPQPVIIKQTRPWKAVDGIWVPLIAFIILGILTLLFSIFLASLSSESFLTFLSSFTGGWRFFIISSFSLVFFIIPYFWIQRYYPEKLSPEQRLNILGLPIKKYTKKELGREIMFGIFMAVIATFLVIGAQYLMIYVIEGIYGIDMKNEIENGALKDFGFDIPNNVGDLLYFVFAVILFVGIPEEVLFRGFVQRSFEQKFTKPMALLLTAIYFSLFHIFLYIIYPPIFLFLFVPYLAISLLLGYVRNIRGDLYAAVIMHIVYDILQTIFMYIIFFS